MNYELAKKLKDAGFPQNCHFYMQDGVEEWCAPCLSELIEACGEDFEGLVKVPKEYGGWAACKSMMDFNYDKFANGTTPEEAVAKLYLSINQKL